MRNKGKQKRGSRRGNACRFLLPFAILPALLLGAGCQSNPKAAAAAFAKSGQGYMKQEKFSQAAIQFRNALQKDPSNWDTRYQLSQAEAKLKDWAACYRDLNAVLAAQPSFLPAHLDLAQLELMAGRTDLAKQEIRKALQLKPHELRAEILEMKFDLAAKDFQSAQKQCELLRKLQPKDSGIEGMCGLANLGLKDNSAAESHFRQALSLDPSSASNTRNLANVLEVEGHADKAEALLTGAAGKYPNSLDMQLVLADFYVRHGRLQQAESLLSGLSNHHPVFNDLAATLGDFWMDHNDLHRAVTEYHQAESAHADPRVERNLASAYLTLRQIPEAERFAQIILKRDPQSPDGRAIQGALDYLKGNYDKASSLLEGALKDNPDSLMAKFYLGATYQATGQLGRAKSAFNDCIAMNDKFLQAYVRLGQIALGSGDWHLGAGYAQRVFQVNPASPDAYLLLAQADMMHDDLGQAGRIITEAEKLPGVPPQIHQVAARYQILKANYPAAQKEFDLASSGAPDAFPLVSWYVEQLASVNQTQRAIAVLQKWMGTSRPSRDASDLLASLYLRTGQLDQAETTARQVLSQDAQMAAAHDVLGQVYERRHQTVQAADQYAAAVRAAPGEEPGYLMAAGLSFREGDYAQAQNQYQAALGRFPASNAAKLGLARVLAARGSDLDRALGIAQDLKSQFPSDARVADTLGWIYHQKGFQPLALPQLEQAAKALPDDATVQFHLGMTLDASGDKTRGHALLNRALKLGLAPPDGGAADRELGFVSAADAKSH